MQSDFLEQLQITPAWWESRWWQQPDYKLDDIAADRIERAISVLREFFDERWVETGDDKLVENIVFRRLHLVRGTASLTFMIVLAEALDRLRNVPGFVSKVNDLKAHKSGSAHFELMTADALALQGFELRFPKEGKAKSPDIVATRGKLSLAMECKYLQREERKLWEDNFVQSLMAHLPREKDSVPIAIDLALNPRLSELRLGSNEALLNQAISNAITEKIVDAISLELRDSPLPFTLVIPEFAEANVHEASAGDMGSLVGPEITTTSAFRRIMQNGVFKACEQLPKGMPGLAIVHSDVLPGDDFFDTLFNVSCKADRERFGHLAGVLLSPLQTIFHTSPPKLFLNRHSNFSAQMGELKTVFTETFLIA